MNPFSAFQPRYHTLQGAPSFGEIDNMRSARVNEKQRALENEQQNARSNASLKLQQDYQSRKFSKEDQAEVEGLLAEYQTAEDQGDHVGLSRVAQKLQRFGMQVSPQGVRSPEAKGLPTQPLPNLRDFTGETQANPIDQAVQDELQSRAALREKNAAPEQDLSQEDFESQLINESESRPKVDRYETSGVNNGVFGTTPEFKARLDAMSPDDAPVDMGDVDSPEFQAAAAKEAPTDLGDVDSPEFQAAAQREEPQRSPEAVGLPTQPFRGSRISKNGQTLYESSGPSGRWSPMVQAVFEPYTSHEDPGIAQAAKLAQAQADKLIHVDGVSPKEAIDMAAKGFQAEATRLTGLQRTVIGSKSRGGGGGGGGGVNAKSRAVVSDDMDSTMRLPQFTTKGIAENILGYDSALNAIGSANSASQYDAVNQMIQARSGKVVSDRERAIYNNMAGMWNGWMKQFNLLNGGELPEQYRQKLQTLMQEAKSVLIQERDKRAAAAAAYHTRKLQGRGMAPADIKADADAVASAIREGAAPGEGDPNADLYE